MSSILESSATDLIYFKQFPWCLAECFDTEVLICWSTSFILPDLAVVTVELVQPLKDMAGGSQILCVYPKPDKSYSSVPCRDATNDYFHYWFIC